ncbi:MAG: hypothetical protein ACP5RT_02860 [Candidatus Micrarchaeia archaeon]
MAVITINPRKKLIKAHKPRRRGMIIDFIREEAARHLKGEKENVNIDTELNKVAQFTAKHMRKIKIEIAKEGEIIRAKPYKEPINAKAEATNSEKSDKKAQKKAKSEVKIS